MCGCGGPPKRAPSAPPPVFSTSRQEAANRNAIEAANEALARAKSVQAYVTDPNAKGEIALVVGQLVRVTAALRESEEARLVQQEQARALRDWGVGKEEEASANGEGWRKEKEKSDRRGRLLGTAFAVAGVGLALRVVTVAPVTWLFPLGTGLLGWIAAQYLT